MTNRDALLACYRSGQMSPAQFMKHCEDEPGLLDLVKGADSEESPDMIARKALRPIRGCATDEQYSECMNNIMTALIAARKARES